MSSHNGQSNIEYALIVALITLTVIAILVLLGPRVAGVFQRINSDVEQIAST